MHIYSPLGAQGRHTYKNCCQAGWRRRSPRPPIAPPLCSGGARVLDRGEGGQKMFSRAPNSFLTALLMQEPKLNVIFKFTIVTFKLTILYDIVRPTCNNYYNKNVYFIT